jgi:glycolate oxidase FAD binding subunit
MTSTDRLDSAAPLSSPGTVAALQDTIRSAPAVSIVGGATKVPPARDEVACVGTGRLTGVVDYSPEECVVTVRAGTSLREIEATLRQHGQHLPFDPPFSAAGATIGGTVAMGLSGPGRLRYGGVRDFLIGATVVDGEGRVIQSGGKVVKNAAGFLLHHALVGSLGTLGVLAELSFKVFPAPQTHVTLRYRHASLAAAHETVERIRASRLDIEALDYDAAGSFWMRLSGRSGGLRSRLDRARRLFAHAAALEVLDETADERVWSDAREFAWCPADASLIKIPTVPSIVSSLATLQGDAARIRFSSNAAVAWLAWSDNLDDLSDLLVRLSRPALVVRGSGAGRRLGTAQVTEFESRVRRVMDPLQRFRAASASAR